MLTKLPLLWHVIENVLKTYSTVPVTCKRSRGRHRPPAPHSAHSTVPVTCKRSRGKHRPPAPHSAHSASSSPPSSNRSRPAARARPAPWRESWKFFARPCAATATASDSWRTRGRGSRASWARSRRSAASDGSWKGSCPRWWGWRHDARPRPLCSPQFLCLKFRSWGGRSTWRGRSLWSPRCPLDPSVLLSGPSPKQQEKSCGQICIHDKITALNAYYNMVNVAWFIADQRDKLSYVSDPSVQAWWTMICRRLSWPCWHISVQSPIYRRV